MARSLSLGGILSRTEAPPDGNGELVDDQADDGSNGEPRPRGRRVAVGEKVRGRKLQLPDSVFERLSLHAIKRKTNASAIAAEILDRNLPKHRIATDD
jgi:hypothetical protein